MANTGNNRKRTSSTRSRSTKKTTNRKVTPTRTVKDYKMRFEIASIIAFAICVLLFLCNFGIIGLVGNAISRFLFGILGFIQYIFPLFLLFLFFVAWRNPGHARGKVISITALLFFIGNIIELISGISRTLDKYSIKEFYSFASENKAGGGLISGSFTYLLSQLLGVTGTVIISIIGIIICIIIATEDTIVTMLKESREGLSEKNNANRLVKEEYILERQRAKQQSLDAKRAAKEQKDEERNKRLQQKASALELKDLEKQSKEDEKILRVNQKVSGVTENTLLTPVTYDLKNENNDIHEITLNEFDDEDEIIIFEDETEPVFEATPIIEPVTPKKVSVEYKPVHDIANITIQKETTASKPSVPEKKSEEIVIPEAPKKEDNVSLNFSSEEEHKVYQFPPIDLLTLNTNKSGGDSEDSIRETASKLINTLEIFGVKASVDTICQGPTVTRFELVPELGTKVSRIKGLSDDIKLNLATSDIRIEAPIPGKSAVGIEIPNKVNQAVLLRDLIDTNEFKKSSSSLTFAVGKDISGKVIVYDIDQFPHLLIAGATGSGKSVCINTLILSLIYKAHPDEVKMIMIDPKVVELSVYNGIPHLLIPVVTEPKKASAALNWAVTEMMDRYKKFADLNVRDLKGYNQAVIEREKTEGPSELYKKLPQIVIIVDELADLMMVAKNEVEDAICRLAQLARACGIHLIIATQRPSVDVITGLIKANMPSRIAFAVSSNIDSRTILDMGGAEELLGKGDMLFYPKGLKKPVRLQGAFVSDGDVNKIVDFLKPQASLAANNSVNIQNQIESTITSSSSSGASGSAGSGEDELLVDAAKYIIQNDKASIGNLQRVYRIGFNRAARIMDRLAELGIVSSDEGTKARKVLMSMEELENHLEQGDF